MTQKVLKVGSSAAVTIPKKSLVELGIKIGDRVNFEINKRKRTFTFKFTESFSKEDIKIARLTLDFINRYKRDLKALARK